MKRNSKKEKAVRIIDGYYNDWNVLVKEHPEVSLQKSGSRVIGVNVPASAINITCVIVNNRIYTLEYYDTNLPKDEAHIRYESPFATESELYRIINFQQSR